MRAVVIPLFITLVCNTPLLGIGNLYGQCYTFCPNVRVNDDEPGITGHFTYSSGSHTIAARGDTVYLAWADDRGPGRAVYFSKSTDKGLTWSENKKISGDDNCYFQSLAVDERGYIYVVWSNGYRDIYVISSIDGGESFGSVTVVNDTTSTCVHPSVAVDTSGNVYVAWQDYRESDKPDIYFAKSTDGGLSFGTDIRVDDTGSDTSRQWFPTIGVNGSGEYAHIAWQDKRTGVYHVYSATSTDGGESFESNVLVVDTTGGGSTKDQGNPSLVVGNDGVVYVVWTDFRGNAHIRFSKSIDHGNSFTGETVVSSHPGSWAQTHASLACDSSGNLYIVWDDYMNWPSEDDIYFCMSMDGGDSFIYHTRVDDTGSDGSWQWDPTVAVNESGDVFVAWEDDRHFPAPPGFDIYFATGMLTEIYENVEDGLIDDNLQVKAYPNPFSKCCWFRISPNTSHPRLSVYNLIGQKVRDLPLPGDEYFTLWNGRDSQGENLPPGQYFCSISAGGERRTIKLIKVR